MSAFSDHEKRLRELGCILSRRPNPTLHHCKAGSMTEIIGVHGTAMKVSDWLQIPLDAHYHTGSQGIDSGMGVLTWEQAYGRQVDLLDRLCYLLGYNVWHRAGVDRGILLSRYHEATGKTVIREIA